jgi:hypothetical protein
MIVHAADRAARAQGVTWRQLRAEDLPAELGRFRVVTFAQSFHWMDRRRVARAVRPMFAPGEQRAVARQRGRRVTGAQPGVGDVGRQQRPRYGLPAQASQSLPSRASMS